MMITLYWLVFTLSMQEIVADAARHDDTRNSVRSRRSEPIIPVDVKLFVGDPLSHYLVKEIVKHDRPTLLSNGSVILRGILYNKHCLPSVDDEMIGSIYPRYQDCRTYLERTTHNTVEERKCPKNGIFDPSTSTCIEFYDGFAHDNCIQDCSFDFEVLEFGEAVHDACDRDGSSNSECSQMSTGNTETSSDREVEILPTLHFEDSSDGFGSANFDNPSDHKLSRNSYLEKKILESRRKYFDKIRSSKLKSSLTNSKNYNSNSLDESSKRSKRDIPTEQIARRNDKLLEINFDPVVKEAPIKRANKISLEVTDERGKMSESTKKTGSLKPSSSGMKMSGATQYKRKRALDSRKPASGRNTSQRLKAPTMIR